MRTQPPVVLGSLALLAVLVPAGCAAPARTTGARAPAPGAVPDSATIVVDVNMRRSAELSDSRGALRVFDQEVRVEYRAGGRGSGLDAGEVTLDGRPLRRIVGGKGAMSYRLGRDESGGIVETRDDPWMTLANTGGSPAPAAAARVKLAPFPVVTQPAPGQGVLRSEELAVVMLPPAVDVWYRVSLTGAGDAVNAIDLGQGRWLFPRGSLEHLGQGRARVLIEVETSCGDCEVAERLRASWSSRSQIEVPVTLL
ncbi:MAG: hypothetical protein AAB113_05190 [Candidatus Eisenbacteria bacterium]